MGIILFRRALKAWVLAGSGLLASTVLADEVRVAVAANFGAAIQQLQPLFLQATGHVLNASMGSTGQLVAQIRNGAPFDVFLAADDGQFQPLLETGDAVPDSAFTYAIGQLVLIQGEGEVVDTATRVQPHLQTRAAELAQLLQSADVKIAIANPALAPYGRAALVTLQKLGLYGAVKGRLVMGQNIAQTHQFVMSGVAPLGFVAMAQVMALPEQQRGSWWLVPADLHAPINQQVMLLKRGQDNRAAMAFLTFLRSPAAVTVIQQLGYSTQP